MSLWINPRYVSDVLLPDGWHKVDENKRPKSGWLNPGDGPRKFWFDAYEFGYSYWNGGDRDVFEAKHEEGGLSCSLGFAFIENGQKVAGPASSILAVKYSEPPPVDRSK